MKHNSLVQKIWWIGVTLFLLLGCRLQGMLTPTSVSLTATPILPMPTAISLTVPPASPTVTNVQAEQARAFAGPILQAITNREPDFTDDFSAANRGWDSGFGVTGQEGKFAIEDGVARFRMGQGDAFMFHDALNQKDFVLQLDARLAEGDQTSLMQVFFHNLSPDYWFNINLYSELQTWHVDKSWAGQDRQLTNGSGNISPITELTHVMIVTRGAQAAIYLNDEPMAYFEDADFDASGQTLLMCTSTSRAVCEFDNVKFWDLSKVTGLP